MAAYSGAVFVESAYRVKVPARAVAHKCRNWGLAPERAADLAELAAAEAYYRSLNRCFESEDHYRAWVTRTALNWAIEQLRRESRSQSLTWIAPAPDGASEEESIAEGLSKGLATLTEEERTLLALTYQSGLTLDQIASQMATDDNRSDNAKRLRIKRKRDNAQRKLRTYLIQNGYRHARPVAETD